MDKPFIKKKNYCALYLKERASPQNQQFSKTISNSARAFITPWRVTGVLIWSLGENNNHVKNSKTSNLPTLLNNCLLFLKFPENMHSLLLDFLNTFVRGIIYYTRNSRFRFAQVYQDKSINQKQNLRSKIVPKKKNLRSKIVFCIKKDLYATSTNINFPRTVKLFLFWRSLSRKLSGFWLLLFVEYLLYYILTLFVWLRCIKTKGK